MAKKPISPTASDADVRALLERYRCRVPFHEVRARFLGNIASPMMEASPMSMVKGLWGGELPTFNSIDAANELIGALVMGLWNRLTRHQERSQPFRLRRPDVTVSRDGLADIALVRRQELDGFIEGLFGADDRINLPERAHKALGALAEMRALFAGIVDLCADPQKSAAPKDIDTTLRRVRDMTRIAETEIHALVLSCTRSRRQMLETLPVRRPTLN
jgi:hypothetical protein